METYVKGIIVIGAVCSVILTALPHGDERTGRYVKYIAHLVTLLVIISPLSGLFSFAGSFTIDIPETEESESTSHTAVIAQAAENISRFITESCAEKFALDPVNVKVRLILDESDTENVKLEEIQIFCDEKRSEEKERIRRHFEELFETRVFVFGP
jgi:hypothetical protein